MKKKKKKVWHTYTNEPKQYVEISVRIPLSDQQIALIKSLPSFDADDDEAIETFNEGVESILADLVSADQSDEGTIWWTLHNQVSALREELYVSPLEQLAECAE